MANRVYLYAADNYKSASDYSPETENIMSVSEFPYGIPLFMVLLCYQPITLSDSTIWKDMRSIVSEYESGFLRFKKFVNEMSRLDILTEKMKTEVDKAVDYLEKNKRKYFILETAEVQMMNYSTPEDINKDIQTTFDILQGKEEDNGLFVLKPEFNKIIITLVDDTKVEDGIKISMFRKFVTDESWEEIVGVYTADYLYFTPSNQKK